MKSEQSVIRIYNGIVLSPQQNLGRCTILIRDGKIIGIESGDFELEGSIGYDAKGLYVSPGFIDMHTHGAGGSDFMDCTVEDCRAIAHTHMLYGTTLLYPTTLASDNAELMTFIDVYDKVKNNTGGAQFGGLHLEGPYFAYAYRGAQDPKYLRNPSPEEYMEVLERSKDIVRWDVAPELPGALQFGDELVKRGILASIAHTDAVYEDIVEAIKHGFTHITHFYSCMNGITRRNGFRFAGCIEAGYLLDELTIELITDGIHVPAPLMQLAVKAKGVDKTALVTDSMRGAGMPEGKSILGSRAKGQEVIIEDGVAKMPDRQAFAGSVATADRLVRNMKNMGKRTIEEAVTMMTWTPANIMGIQDRKGKIAKGYDADLIVFDDNIHVQQVFIHGESQI